METITPDVLWLIVIASTVFLLCVMTALYFLQRYKSKMLIVRLDLMDAILEKKFFNFLETFRKIPPFLFTKLSPASLNVISAFITENFKEEHFPYILEVHKFLELNNKELVKFFEKALENKQYIYWSNLYFIDFVNNDAKNSKDLKILFSNFYYVYHMKILHEVLFELDRFNDTLVRDSNMELKKRLKAEVDRLKGIVA
ncbi:MAG: hypothetical protein ACOYL8_00315 [Patescibacteria group bacterium]